MMRIQFKQTPKKNKPDPNLQRRFTIPSTYCRGNLAGNAANKVFINSVNGADPSTGNFLIAAAYNFN
jgi:hypothetical protein